MHLCILGFSSACSQVWADSLLFCIRTLLYEVLRLGTTSACRPPCHLHSELVQSLSIVVMMDGTSNSRRSHPITLEVAHGLLSFRDGHCRTVHLVLGLVTCIDILVIRPGLLCHLVQLQSLFISSAFSGECSCLPPVTLLRVVVGGRGRCGRVPKSL